MAKIDTDRLSECCQPTVECIEKFVLFHIILRINPFFLQFPLHRFSNIQMWGIWWQEGDKQTSLLPKRNPFHNGSGFMYTAIIRYQYGFLFNTQRELFQKLGDQIGSNVVFRCYFHVLASSVDKPRNVDFIGLLYSDMNILCRKLPAIGNIFLRTNMGFISIIKINRSRFTKSFKLTDYRYLVTIICFVRLAFGAGSYPLISSANTLKKRRSVLLLIDFPQPASHSALAVCKRRRWDLMAANKLSLSSASKTGLRPCPALLCKPEIPSDLKCLTQWFTLTWLMSVNKPTSLELRPEAFKRITWHRRRKEWLSPFFKPSSKAWRSGSESDGVLIRPMATKIRNNIK